MLSLSLQTVVTAVACILLAILLPKVSIIRKTVMKTACHVDANDIRFR